MSKDVNCPYCGEWLEICHDEGVGYEEDTVHEQECSHCDKTFVFTTSISYYYKAAKADCLNGAPHSYKPTCTYPKEHTKMVCQDCEESRPMATEEMAEFLQTTKEG